MSTSSQFYTGADPSYFPASDPRKKAGRLKLVRIIAGPVTWSLIGSVAMVVIGVRWFWQAPPAPAELQLPARRQVQPEVRLAFSVQEAEVKRSGRGHEAGVVSEPSESQTIRLRLPANPQVQQIILEAPPLLPPFPTEHNVAVGTARARLVRAFGKPDLRARTMQQDRLVETYVYEQPDRATIILIEDGSVVSAHTGQPQRIRVLSSEPEPEN